MPRQMNFPSCASILAAQVYDMKRPLQLPLEDYDGMREMLDAEEHVEIDRNAWKRDEWKDGEDIGKHLPCAEQC